MNILRVQKIFWMILVAIVALPSINAYSYSLRGEMRTYYLDDIWSEEMFIEPVKDFIQDEFNRYGYRHTPHKDDADVRIHVTVHSVKNKPEGIRPFLIWPFTGKRRDIGEARLSARIIDNQTNREVWANSIKGRKLENLILGWAESPRRVRMRAFRKALDLLFDPYFVSEMPLFD